MSIQSPGGKTADPDVPEEVFPEVGLEAMEDDEGDREVFVIVEDGCERCKLATQWIVVGREDVLDRRECR